MIWRNDDVSYKTEVGQFAEVHKLFKKYTVLHTVAVICKDIKNNGELIRYINENNIDVQIHCYDHVDFTLLTEPQIKHQLTQCVEIISKHFKSQYIRTDGDVAEDVINFHSWALPEIIILEDALKLYSTKR